MSAAIPPKREPPKAGQAVMLSVLMAIVLAVYALFGRTRQSGRERMQSGAGATARGESSSRSEREVTDYDGAHSLRRAPATDSGEQRSPPSGEGTRQDHALATRNRDLPHGIQIAREDVAEHGPPDTIVELHNYDVHSGLLSLRVTFLNKCQRPVYLIGDDFAFVKGKDGSLPSVPLELDGESLTLDFSRQKWAQLGRSKYLTERWGGTSLSSVIELRPWQARHVTYVIQFPLKNGYGTYQPRGKKELSVRFGWAKEPMDDFVRRVRTPAPYDKDARSEQIRTQWQSLLTTEPIVVDFGNPETEK